MSESKNASAFCTFLIWNSFSTSLAISQYNLLIGGLINLVRQPLNWLSCQVIGKMDSACNSPNLACPQALAIFCIISCKNKKCRGYGCSISHIFSMPAWIFNVCDKRWNVLPQSWTRALSILSGIRHNLAKQVGVKSVQFSFESSWSAYTAVSMATVAAGFFQPVELAWKRNKRITMRDTVGFLPLVEGQKFCRIAADIQLLIRP